MTLSQTEHNQTNLKQLCLFTWPGIFNGERITSRLTDLVTDHLTDLQSTGHRSDYCRGRSGFDFSLHINCCEDFHCMDNFLDINCVDINGLFPNDRAAALFSFSWVINIPERSGSVKKPLNPLF